MENKRKHTHSILDGLHSSHVVKFHHRMKTSELKLYEEIMKIKMKRFQMWKDSTEHDRLCQQIRDERNKLVDILLNSKRGERTVDEKDFLKKYMSNYIGCLPKQLSSAECDIICNEIDWVPTIGKMLLFLQGDFGNCYYIIAEGSVSLYLEPSKDEEIRLARDFGRFRGKVLPDEIDLNALGNNFLNLSRGAGFGEFAILNATQKLRSCAALTSSTNSIVFVMHANTYDTCLRKFHFRQHTLSSAIKLLQDIPTFNQIGHSKVSQLAFAMTKRTFSSSTIICTPKDLIDKVMVVASGEVKVTPKRAKFDVANTSLRQLESRLPNLSIVSIGRGQIIGEKDINTGESHYSMTYTANYTGCDIFELPLQSYRDHMQAVRFMRFSEGQDELEDAMNRTLCEREAQHMLRVSRTTSLMRIMVMDSVGAVAIKKKDVLTALPSIVELPGFLITDANIYASFDPAVPLLSPAQARRNQASTVVGMTFTKDVGVGKRGSDIGGASFSSANSSAAPPAPTPTPTKGLSMGLPPSHPSPRQKKNMSLSLAQGEAVGGGGEDVRPVESTQPLSGAATADAEGGGGSNFPFASPGGKRLSMHSFVKALLST